MVRIAVMVPSRGRPGNIDALLAVAMKTMTTSSVSLFVCVDGDDPELRQYQRVFETRNPPAACLMVGEERQRLGPWLNGLGPWLAESRDIGVIGFMGDDHRPLTPGWDKMVSDHFMDTVNGVMYGNDLIHGPNLPTAVFMDARIVRTLGWFTVPGQIHLFMDNTWKKIGEELGTLHYEPSMVIEHLHPIAQKSGWDQTYIEANDGGVGEHDKALFDAWVAGPMKDDIERIRNA